MPIDALTKSCACTGVRWCASCRDPRVRRRHRMDDPVPIPDLLSSLSRDAGLRPGDGLYDFDLDLQSAPRCPDFRGVHVFRDFISVGDSEQLLREIEKTSFIPAQSGKSKQHYGPKVNFNKQKINPTTFPGLPDYTRHIESRLHELARKDLPGIPADNLALCTALATFETTDAFVLRYLERDASNLDFHCDDTFAYGEAILDLSLESDSVLTFLERQTSAGQTSERKCVRVPLPARSLAVVYGPARFCWDHAILANDISGRRTSITLRTLNETLRHSDVGRRILRIARGNTIQS
jgi:alkylated DNA repair protein alkB family protein 4